MSDHSQEADEGLQMVVEESLEFAQASYAAYLLQHTKDLRGDQLKTLAYEEVDYKSREYSDKRMMGRVNYANTQLTKQLRSAAS